MAQAEDQLRYDFGKNWADFIKHNFSEDVVGQSQRRLAEFLRLGSLEDTTFLDIGCGSGLHSLAAHRLGARRIFSFDYDRDSVATTERLRQYAGDPASWTVQQGSVLDPGFMQTLGEFDIVYSWGVLHHTGDMWRAVRNAALPLKPDGLFLMALYSADHHVDPPAEYWLTIKRQYNHRRKIGRTFMEWQYLWTFHIMPALRARQNPASFMKGKRYRGMEFWTDVRDWLGGYPMEFAGLSETRDFCKRELGLDLVNLGIGEANTEFLFCRLGQNEQWTAIDARRQHTPLSPPFTGPNGFGFATHLPALANVSDCSEAPRRSLLMLYENGEPLGLSHSLHDHIAKYGKGRFSHWGDYLLFSASDNSDPNGNNKRYTYCESY